MPMLQAVRLSLALAVAWCSIATAGQVSFEQVTRDLPAAERQPALTKPCSRSVRLEPDRDTVRLKADTTYRG